MWSLFMFFHIFLSLTESNDRTKTSSMENAIQYFWFFTFLNKKKSCLSQDVFTIHRLWSYLFDRTNERENHIFALMNFARGLIRLPLAKYYWNVINMTQLKGTKMEILWHKAWAECLTAISSVCGFAYAIIALTRLPLSHILSRWYT